MRRNWTGRVADRLRVSSKGMGTGAGTVVGKPRCLTTAGRRRQLGLQRTRTEYVVGRTCHIAVLLVPQTAAATWKVRLLWLGFLSFPLVVGRILLYVVVSFCCVCNISGGGTPLLFLIFNFYSGVLFCLFLRLFRFSLGQRIWIASICMSYLSYPVRWHVITLSALLIALQYIRIISASWFCDRRELGILSVFVLHINVLSTCRHPAHSLVYVTVKTNLLEELKHQAPN